MNFAGIDPGFQGALAILTTMPGHMPRVAFTCDMPILHINKAKEIDIAEIIRIINAYEVGYVLIEKAQVLPKQGVVSSGNYMKNYGMVIGCLIATKTVFTEVPPQRWKKDLRLATGKDAAIALVRRLFPDVNIARKKDHNICEAILIAYWGITCPYFGKSEGPQWKRNFGE